MKRDEMEIASELYAFVKEYALLKWDDETKRYESLIQQASNIQTAFSFSTAALFMIAPIAIEYRGKMPLGYLLLVFSSVTFFLILSLVLASMAQRRGAMDSLADIRDFEDHIENNYESFLTRAQQEKALAKLIGEVQLSASEKNNVMSKRIERSMLFFYIAIGLCAFWFIISIIILYRK